MVVRGRWGGYDGEVLMGRYCSVMGDVIGAVLFIIVDSVWMVWLFNYECHTDMGYFHCV
jgi:hypothetical protein